MDRSVVIGSNTPMRMRTYGMMSVCCRDWSNVEIVENV